MVNVDINASNLERVRAMWQLISECIEDLHPSSSSDYKINLKKFLLHVAWHEGKFLKARIQDPWRPGEPNGPGRSFFQFEPARAKEAVDYAKRKESDRGWLTRIALKAGKDSKTILDANEALIEATKWPPGNLIERLLIDNDLFGVYLARIAFSKIPESIPMENSSHAEYWAKHWKRVFDNDAQRTELVRRFAEESNMVDTMAPI